MIQLNRTGSAGARLPRASRDRLVTALAVLSLAVLSAAPAVAKATHEPLPHLFDARPGTLVSLSPSDMFDNVGTNPRFTSAFVPIREFLEEHYISTDPHDGSSRLHVRVKTTDALNALPSPPPNPFYTWATVAMTNDEEQTFARNVTFETRYLRKQGLVYVPGQPPTVYRTIPFLVPAGTFIRIYPRDVFDNSGTNPVFTEVSFSTTDYFHQYSIMDAPGHHNHGTILVQAKDNDQLNALPSPPPNPAEVTATVTITNDEEQTATAKVTIETAYLRNATD